MPTPQFFDAALTESLALFFLALGDDELLLGHRDSEWCGHAPILEEDIAFANLALDEIGHATYWYELYAGLVNENPEQIADHLVFERPWKAWRNIQIVELPRGDWAFSVLRQYLFDSAEVIRLEALARSSYVPLAGVAGKIRKEELYHLRHSRAWIQRLGLGTQESQSRLQNALQSLWPYTNQMWQSVPGEDRLMEAGLLPGSQALQTIWLEQTSAFLRECALTIPSTPPLILNRTQHTTHLKTLIAEMHSVFKLDPQAQW